MLQKINIVDDARERRLDVVRNVCDKFRFEPLALELLVDGRSHAVADGIQVLGVALNVPIHPLCVHLRVKIAGGEGFALLLELAELDGEQAHRDGQDKQERDELPASVIKLVRHQADHHTDDEAAHHRAPDERDGVQKAHNAAAEGAEHAPAPLDDLPAQA